VTLKVSVDEKGSAQRFDSIFAYVASCNDSTLELVFTGPHGSNADYPFRRHQKMELTSDHEGMGVCAQAVCIERRGGDRLIIELAGDLNFFNRRRNVRVEADLWVGLEESPVSISIIHRRWEEAIRWTRKKKSNVPTASFSRRKVSLSTSGMGLEYPKPVQPGTYFLIHLALEDNGEMICIAGEVVRSEPEGNDSFYLGIHFDCIEEDDRHRIDQHVKQNARRTE